MSTKSRQSQRKSGRICRITLSQIPNEANRQVRAASESRSRFVNQTKQRHRFASENARFASLGSLETVGPGSQMCAAHIFIGSSVRRSGRTVCRMVPRLPKRDRRRHPSLNPSIRVLVDAALSDSPGAFFPEFPAPSNSRFSSDTLRTTVCPDRPAFSPPRSAAAFGSTRLSIFLDKPTRRWRLMEKCPTFDVSYFLQPSVSSQPH